MRGLSGPDKSLTARMGKMEQNILNLSTSNTRLLGHERYSVSVAFGQGLFQPNIGASDNPNHRVSQQQVHSSPQREGYQSLLPTDQIQGDRPTSMLTQPFSCDAHNHALVPNIDVLRRIPSVSKAVNKVSATDDSQLHSDLTQGKNSAKKFW